MIYGGGFGAETTGTTYKQAFDRARGLLAHVSASDQDKILGGTALRLFKFGA
jgi:predicted TIM-barrel fold metal-dependent hydrolase